MPKTTKPGHRGQTQPVALDRRIQTHWKQLPSSEQRIAEFLLNSPNYLVSHNATELAALANTSKAAVSRLIHRLGYRSFTDARQQARNAQDWGSPLYMGSEADTPDETLKGKLAKQFASESTNFDKTWRSLDDSTLTQAIALMTKARRVTVLGYRNSAYLAMYLTSQLGLLREAVSSAATNSDSLARALLDLEPEDLVVSVAMRRRVPELLKAHELIRRRQTPLVIITDPSGLSITHPSDLVITCHCQTQSLFDSYAAPMSVLNFLLGLTAQKLGDQARTRLRDAEAVHAELKDLI